MDAKKISGFIIDYLAAGIIIIFGFIIMLIGRQFGDEYYAGEVVCPVSTNTILILMLLLCGFIIILLGLILAQINSKLLKIK